MRKGLVAGELSLERAAEALEGNLADIIYTDPPWGPRMIYFFHTMNKSTGEDWIKFMNTLGSVISKSIKPGGPIFIEMGEQWTDELMAVLDQWGLPKFNILKCVYGSEKRPSNLLYTGVSDLKVEHLHGVGLVIDALKAVGKPGDLVFDPCCGKGMTAKASFKVGMRFAGVELNPDRAVFTSNVMKKNGY